MRDVSKKIKDIANRFCNIPLDEILKLPDPAGYEFIDGFYDQAISSRQFISESHFYRPDDVVGISKDENDRSFIDVEIAKTRIEKYSNIG